MKIGKDGKPVMDEESVVTACMDILRLNGARVHRVVERIPLKKHRWEKKSEGGIPDTFFWWPKGHSYYEQGVIFMEVKRPGGVPSAVQTRWLGQATEDGRLAFCIDSVEGMGIVLRYHGIFLLGL